VIDNRYSFCPPQDKFKRTSATCKLCKQLEREVENYKRTVSSLKEKTAVNEKHLKQYESLLLIKENRLKERESSINELYDGLQGKVYSKVRDFQRDFKFQLKEKGISECSVQTTGIDDFDFEKKRLQEKNLKIEKILEEISIFSQFPSEKSYKPSRKLNNSHYKNLTIILYPEINLIHNKRSSLSTQNEKESQTDRSKLLKFSSKVTKSSQTESFPSDLPENVSGLKDRESLLSQKLQKILEKESEMLKFSSDLQKRKIELDQQAKNLSLSSRKDSKDCFSSESRERSGRCDRCEDFLTDESRKDLELMIEAHYKKKRDSLTLSHECTVGTTRQTSVKSTPERNFSKLQESIIKDQQLFRSPQEVSSNMKINGFKSIEDNEYSFFKQLSMSGNSDCIEGLTPIRKSSFLEKDFDDKSDEKNNDKSCHDHSDNSGNELQSLPHSRDEPTHQLSIVARLKAKLQQKAYEAEQQVKLKEFFYQQENEKFMKIIQQFESFNLTLSKENQELKEKLKNLTREFDVLNEEKERNLQVIQKFEEDFSEFNRKVEELNEENSKLEELNGKLKARLLIYKNKRVSHEGSEVLHEELDQLIHQMHEKLLGMQEKEKELMQLKRELSIEHENNLNNAECLKILFSDLSREKKDLLAAKEEFAFQKAAVIEIEKNHQQQGLLLDIKEKELLRFKDELVEKERIFSAYNRRSPTKMFKRMNTQLGKLKQDSSDTF
jgi:hypothetical protein